MSMFGAGFLPSFVNSSPVKPYLEGYGWVRSPPGVVLGLKPPTRAAEGVYGTCASCANFTVKPHVPETVIMAGGCLYFFPLVFAAFSTDSCPHYARKPFEQQFADDGLQLLDADPFSPPMNFRGGGVNARS